MKEENKNEIQNDYEEQYMILKEETEKEDRRKKIIRSEQKTMK